MSQPRHPPGKEDQVYAEVAETVNLCLEAGQPPDVAGLVAQHPELADEIQQLVPLVTTLHQLGRDPEPTTRPAKPPAARPARPLGRVGDYRILREIASGGMGVVYEAEHTLTGKRVALKVLPFQQTLDPRHVKRFKIGGYVARQLKHRNIVPVYEVGRRRGVYYQVMRYVDGPSLATVIEELRERLGYEVGAPKRYSEATRILAESLRGAREDSSPPPRNGDTANVSAQLTGTEGLLDQQAYFRTVAHLGLQAADALEYLHSLDHVHRDVKPANLLWERGRLWLTDFGLVWRPGRGDLTGPGELVGTLRYMSPEQVLGRRDRVGRCTDIYGLGMTLYELLTLEPAFGESGAEALKRQIVYREPRRPRRYNPAVPPDLETVVLKALAKEPAERYQTAQEMADDLRRFLEGKPVLAPRVTRWQQVKKWARRRQLALASGLVAAALLVGATAWAWAAQRAAEHSEARQFETAAAALMEEGRQHAAVFPYRRQLTPDWIAAPHTQTLTELDRLVERCEQLAPAEADDHPELKCAAAANYLYAAFRYRLLDEDGKAWASCRAARMLLQQLEQGAYGGAHIVCTLAACHNELGHLALRAGRYQEGEQALQQARSLLAPCVAHFRQAPAEKQRAAQFRMEFTRYRYELAGTLLELGNVLRLAKRALEAEHAYREAIVLYEELAAQTAAPADYHFELAGALNNLGLLLTSERRPGEAEKCHVAAREWLTKLVKEEPLQMEYASRLGVTLVLLAGLPTRQGNAVEACSLLEEAAGHHRTALQLRPGDKAYRENLRETLVGLTAAQLRLGQHAAAAATAAELPTRFPEDWQEQYRGAAFLAYCMTGAERDPRLSPAERTRVQATYSEQVREYVRSLALLANEQPAAQNQLAWFLATNPVPQLRSPGEAVALAKQAVAAAPTDGAYWNTLGVAQYRAGQFEEAVAALRRAAKFNDGGDCADRFFLAMSCWQLGDREQAREWYAQAVDLLNKQTQPEDELQAFRAEAQALLRAPGAAP